MEAVKHYDTVHRVCPNVHVCANDACIIYKEEHIRNAVRTGNSCGSRKCRKAQSSSKLTYEVAGVVEELDIDITWPQSPQQPCAVPRRPRR